MIIYLGVPEQIMDSKIQEIRNIQEKIAQMGHSVILPIGGEVDKPSLSVSDAVVMLEGWKKDKASHGEVEYANSLGIPVYEYPDVPDLHPTEARCPNQADGFREILGKMYRVHLKKNADYSPANIAGTGEIGLITRLWDKMARLMNLEGFNLHVAGMSYSAPKEAKNESIEDTFMDMAVYAIIGLLYRSGKWGN